jgi:L,D-transpeptidase catalytic domain
MKHFGVVGVVSNGARAGSTGLRAVLAGGTAMMVLLTVSAPALAYEYFPRQYPDYRRQFSDYYSPYSRYRSPGFDHPYRAPAAKRGEQTGPKDTKRDQHAKKELPKRLQVPLIAISIANQRLTLYDNGVPIAHAPVSTGVPGHPTPTGIFSVIQKELFHRSNIYSGAPMPYMQRITWSGVALHAGVLPGHPASHGCIRMPSDFATKLYGMTRLGARVIITRNEIAPVSFEHGRLFVLNKGEPSTVGQASEPKRMGEGAQDDWIKTVKRESIMTSDAAGNVTPALAGIATQKAAEVVAPATPESETATGSVLVKPIPLTLPQPVEMPTTFKPRAEPNAAPAAEPALEAYGPPRPLRPGPITVFISKKEGKVFVRKGFQPLFDAPVTIARPDLPLGTHLFTAIEPKADGASFRWLAVTMPTEASRTVGMHDAKPGRIFRSASFVMPAVQPQTAAQALERIEMPPEAVAQISALMSPGASLIISDQGRGPETGSETDFIVLTR